MLNTDTNRTAFRKKTHLFVWILVLTLTAAMAVGDVDEITIVAQGDEGGPSAGAAVGGDDDVTPGQPIQTIVFKQDTTIQQALRILGQRYQKNIVPSPKVDGVLSFTRLYDVTFDEAMEAILGPNLKYEQVGQLTKVYTKDEYKQIKEDTDRMVHKLFTLYYVTAQEAEKLIKPVLSTNAKVVASTAAEKEIAGGGSGGAGATGGLGGGGGGDSPAQNDTIVVYDFPENIQKAEAVIEALDRRPKQVLVEATILSARLTEGMSLGVDLNLLSGANLETSETQGQIGTTDLTQTASTQNPLEQTAAGVAGNPIQITGFASLGGSGLRAGITAGDFVGFITALESVTDVTVLANPKILAVNKQEGSVLIGRNLGYRSSTTISAGGVATEGEVKFLQTGTQLVFRPYIGDDGYIRMDIYPKDSTAELNSDGVPDETTTELRTNIVVKDGETIVLGGLFRDVVSTTRNQIPLLGDIPIIGALFRGTNDVVQREEVIILLTPHIVDRAGQTDGEARQADIARKRYGARQTLQGIGRTKLAEDHYVKAVELYTNENTVEAYAELEEALRLRPTYLEALRLRETLIGEITPDEVSQIERIMLGVLEDEEAPIWKRP
jgi:type IV pilus assembly protein PilQ